MGYWSRIIPKLGSLADKFGLNDPELTSDTVIMLLSDALIELTPQIFILLPTIYDALTTTIALSQAELAELSAIQQTVQSLPLTFFDICTLPSPFTVELATNFIPSTLFGSIAGRFDDYQTTMLLQIISPQLVVTPGLVRGLLPDTDRAVTLLRNQTSRLTTLLMALLALPPAHLVAALHGLEISQPHGPVEQTFMCGGGLMPFVAPALTFEFKTITHLSLGLLYRHVSALWTSALQQSQLYGELIVEQCERFLVKYNTISIAEKPAGQIAAFPLALPPTMVVLGLSLATTAVPRLLARSQTTPFVPQVTSEAVSKLNLSQRVLSLALHYNSKFVFEHTVALSRIPPEHMHGPQFTLPLILTGLQVDYEVIDGVRESCGLQGCPESAVFSVALNFGIAALRVIAEWSIDAPGGMTDWTRDSDGLECLQNLLAYCARLLNTSAVEMRTEQNPAKMISIYRFCDNMMRKMYCPTFPVRMSAFMLFCNYLRSLRTVSILLSQGVTYCEIYTSLVRFYEHCDAPNGANMLDIMQTNSVGFKIIKSSILSPLGRNGFIELLSTSDDDQFGILKMLVGFLSYGTRVLGDFENFLETLATTLREHPGVQLLSHEVLARQRDARLEAQSDEEQGSDAEVEDTPEDVVRKAADDLSACQKCYIEVCDLFQSIIEACKTNFTAPIVTARLAAICAHAIHVFGNTQTVRLRVPSPQRYGFRPAEMIASSLTLAATASLYMPEFVHEFISVPQFSVDVLKNLAGIGSIRSLMGAAVARVDSFTEKVDLALQEEVLDLADEAPEEYLDSVTYDLMQTPILLPDGHHMDRRTLERHFLEVGHTNPHTNEQLTWDRCVVDERLQREIQEWVQQMRGNVGSREGMEPV